MDSDPGPAFDDAFDRIEGAILPGVATLLRSLLDVAEGGAAVVDPRAYAAEVQTLALELEALTREIGSLSPVAALADVSALADVRRRSDAA